MNTNRLMARRGLERLIGLLLLLSAGCQPSHVFVDEVKSQAEESQAAMRAMNAYEQARQSYLAGNLDQALRQVDESIALKSDTIEPLVLRLQILIDMNRTADVLAAAAAGARVAPDDARFPYYTGIYYERSGQAPEALICYRDASRIDPSAVQYKLAVAELLIETKQLREAESYLKSAIRQHPTAPGLLQTLGALEQIRGNHEQAARHFSEALALAPTAVSLQENMAKACFSAGDCFRALQYLQPLLREPGIENRRDLQSLAAQCYLKCNRPVEARALLLKLVKEPGETTYAQLRLLADGAILLADWPLLRTAANRMIALDPRAAPGYVALAMYHEEQGDRAAALQVLQDYRRLMDGNVPALVSKYMEELQ